METISADGPGLGEREGAGLVVAEAQPSTHYPPYTQEKADQHIVKPGAISLAERPPCRGRTTANLKKSRRIAEAVI